jgi:hypothetical protein
MVRFMRRSNMAASYITFFQQLQPRDTDSFTSSTACSKPGSQINLQNPARIANAACKQLGIYTSIYYLPFIRNRTASNSGKACIVDWTIASCLSLVSYLGISSSLCLISATLHSALRVTQSSVPKNREVYYCNPTRSEMDSRFISKGCDESLSLQQIIVFYSRR